MSRSKKGKKPIGWDYWGKRPIGMGAQGMRNKRMGIKRERAKLKEALLDEPQEPEYDPREYIPSEAEDEF